MYQIKEIFYSLQGEGAHTGRPGVFVRFTGCNLWNGLEKSRNSAICKFCDTDFLGTDGHLGGKYTSADALVDQVLELWPENQHNKYVIFTGGEPGLQLDSLLVTSFQKAGFETAVETNGTKPLPPELDWICLSPKGAAEVVLSRCDELKLVYPQTDCLPERFNNIVAQFRYLSPMNNPAENLISPNQNSHTQASIEYCLNNPQWRLCLQTHKILNIE